MVEPRFIRTEFAYEEAQQIIEGGHPEGKKADFFNEINLLDKFAKILRHKRMSSGALSFDKKEVRFQLDEENNPLGVYFKIGKDANKLIEEFTLLQTEAWQRLLAAPRTAILLLPLLCTVYMTTQIQQLQDLSTFVRQFGHEVRLSSKEAVTNSLNKMF